MSTTNREIPLCFGSSGSVRASTPHQRANWPQEIHVFWPFRDPDRQARRRSCAATRDPTRPRAPRSLGPQLVRGEDRSHEARPLLVGSECEDRRTEHIKADHRREFGGARRGELLVDNDLLGRGAAAAAELGRPRAADVAGLVTARLPAAEERHPLVEGVGHIRGVRRVLGEERAHIFLELPFVRLERELHRWFFIGA